MRGAFERHAHALRCACLRRLAGSGLDIAPLLPRADEGWRLAALQKHATEFSAIADTYGQSVADYMHLARDWLIDHASKSEVRIRMRPGNFEQFLIQERYLTQFEVPGASGGAKHRALRLMIEHTVLGVPTAAGPSDRPIYGYLSGTDEAGQIQQYGEVVLRLRPSVRHRSTFMLGDSLDHALHHFNEPAFVPQPVTKPTTEALIPCDVLVAASLGDAAPPYRYAEAQIYGGLTSADLVQVVYSLSTVPSPMAMSLLDRLGVEWLTTAAPGP